jgi:hypothetical protein
VELLSNLAGGQRLRLHQGGIAGTAAPYSRFHIGVRGVQRLDLLSRHGGLLRGARVLGGEIIRDVNEEPRLRRSSAEHLVRNVIHGDGGPLIHNGWEDEQCSFDSASFTVSSLTSIAARPPGSILAQRGRGSPANRLGTGQIKINNS